MTKVRSCRVRIFLIVVSAGMILALMCLSACGGASADPDRKESVVPVTETPSVKAEEAEAPGKTEEAGEAEAAVEEEEAETDGGISYIPAAEYLADKENSSIVNNFSLKDKMGSDTGYICIINQNAPKELDIPDEYEGLPVIALTAESEAEIELESLHIGRNVRYIFTFLCNNDPGLKEIFIPENVEEVMSAFDYLQDATITIEACPRLTFAFFYSESLRMILNDPAMLLALKDQTLFSFQGKLDREDIELGTKEYFDFLDKVDKDAVLSKGISHFQEKLDPAKEIRPEAAGDYASFLDGPVITMSSCPAIDFSGYFDTERDALLEETEPVYLDVLDSADQYAEDYYPPATDSPEVYFIVEKMGGDFAGYTAFIYYMVYRISVRDMESDELICWFTASPGYAPSSINVGPGSQDIWYELERMYVRDEDKCRTTPEYCVHRYFPGKGK